MGDLPYLVGFSGPPRSGKDTLGNLLAGILRGKGVKVDVLALSLPMRLAVYAYLGLDYTVEHYEAHKDADIVPVEGGGFRSIRQEMISLSEGYVKPRLGYGWWARALLNRTDPAPKVIIVTDMGFWAEHNVFVDALGADRCAWIQVHRDGHDFSGDSRSYVGSGCISRIYNNGDLTTEAWRIYGRLLNQYHWSFL